jgi:hypothetical protein
MDFRFRKFVFVVGGDRVRARGARHGGPRDAGHPDVVEGPSTRWALQP